MCFGKNTGWVVGIIPGENVVFLKREGLGKLRRAYGKFFARGEDCFVFLSIVLFH